MKARRLRAAVVGAGLMGRWHAQALRALGVPVAAVVDPDPVRGRALAARAAGSRWFPDLGAALAAGGIEVAHVCTPAGSHVPLAGLAIDAGLHALVEKPLAPSLDEVEALYGRARAAGRLLCPVHQFLYQRGVRQALARLPGLGPLRHVDLVACSAGAEGRPDAERPALLREILPHALALMARVLPGAAPPAPWHAIAPTGGELRLCAQQGPVSAGILLSLGGRPTRNSLRLIGERGTLHADLFHGFATREGGWGARGYKLARPFAVALDGLAAGGANLALRAVRREWAYPGLRDLVRAFYAAAERSAPPPVPEGETIQVARWLDEIGLPGAAAAYA